MNSIFFIVGVGRSGTSLLQSILSSHSKIGVPSETGFLRNAFFSCKKYKDIPLEELVALFPRLERVEGLLQKNKDRELANELELYRSLLANVGKEHGTSVVGDKDPRLIEFMAATSNLFPQANFIHLIRDPRDVLLSKKKAGWSKGRPAWYHIFANYVQLRIGEYVGKKLGAHRYMVVTYEQILDSPEETITEICDFLNVNFEPSMLTFQEKAKELVSEDEKQWKKETMGPLLKDNTGKWKGKLEQWEVALTEGLCRQAFKIGKYKESAAMDTLPVFSRIMISSLVLVMKGLGSIYISYRIFYQRIIMKWKL